MLQAILCALVGSLTKSGLTYAFPGWRQILGASFLYGVILGNVPQAMIIGAAIQSIYMGLVSPGGNSPSDTGLATAIAVPVGINTGLDVDTCLTLAVPVGLAGTLVMQLRYTILGINARMVDKAAANADTGGIILWARVLSLVVSIACYFPIIFMGIYFGSSLVEKVINALPYWLTHGLSLAGGLLPTMGFALTIKVIGKPTYIPFFIMGFYLTKYLGLGTMAVAIFAVCTALMIAFLSLEKK